MENEKHKPEIGEMIKADLWPFPEKLLEDDGFKDDGFPGCQFRYKNFCSGWLIAVNVKVTGKPHYNGLDRYKSRCKIEFVGDCQPSTFTGGWIFHG